MSNFNTHTAPLPADSKQAEPRVAAISAQLREMARSKGPDVKLPTVRELCRLLRTSINTLDDALGTLETQHVIYRRRGSGVYVSPHIHRKSIVVLLDAHYFQTPGVSPYWGMLWGLCAAHAQSRVAQLNETYEFRIVPGDPDSGIRIISDVIADIRSGRLDGAISIGVGTPPQIWAEVRSLPIVTYAAAGCWMVGGDTRDRHVEAVTDLAAQGCTRIGIWTPVDVSRFMTDRDDTLSPAFAEHAADIRRGHSDTAGRAGVTLDERSHYDAQTIAETQARGERPLAKIAAMTHQDHGYAAACAMFSREPQERPDGILITDDMMTHGALTAFEEMGVRLNRDVRVCSHANVNSVVLYRRADRMARIEVDPEEIARTLFSVLDRLIAGDPPGSAATQLSCRYYPRLSD